MIICDPRVRPELVPAGSAAVVYAEDDPRPNVLPLPSIRTPTGTVITRWSLSTAEIAALVRGEDLYLTILTYNAPLQPVSISVGPCDWTDC